jgi:predicted acylesterase/phospholipase RssA
MMERRSFLRACGAVGLTPALVAASPTSELELHPRALVLSGGGARGAYEAGIVGALAAVGGIADGSPLSPYGIVCGTSIGALNGWFVATGQYTKLRELWYGISAQEILKEKHTTTRDQRRGLFDRAASAVSLISLGQDQTGALRSEPVLDWISRNVDPSTPLLMPLVWVTTNLTAQRPEYFYLRAAHRGGDLPNRMIRAVQLSLGPQTVVREATPDILHRAIFAAAAIPVAFDPVIMPDASGNPNAYCDGGVVINSPVGIAHSLARAADVVLMDPPFEPETNHKGTVGIACGIVGTMLRNILEVEMRNAYFQWLGRRALGRLTNQEYALAMYGLNEVVNVIQPIQEADLRYIRPKNTLPLGVVGFQDELGIGKAYRIGWEDLERGFSVYDWRTFRV